MVRSRRARKAVGAVLVAAALAACGSEVPGGGGDGADARARAHGVTRDLVYVLRLPDHRVVPQSVGVLGGDGYGAVYSDQRGATLQLSVDRAEFTAAGCAAPTVCEEEGELRYRRTGEQHEYALPEGGHVVTISAPTGTVDRALLRRAAESARPASDAEVLDLLPATGDEGEADRPGPAPGRGDLPPHGDGAPDNRPGASG
ncbi:hypothetical protein H3146_13585 [Streptomyces sp. OF3]|uniref:Membrane lipoprotein n=1 Tax=Streptomyces alkaliterrae TaxID=2213162 RepID=A0A5P0YRD9_9ACTN|nr:hypothetical protein [Streptomyces alkaliterrae]MBB1258431.1 hypothetical protein [Streptomyces alkaliterrae]MQS02883.1 hypothetical protein [Streptomyces alkaliterrae]